MRNLDKVWSLSVAGSALGALAALVLSAPAAQADPEVPPPLPTPAPTPAPAEQSITTQAAAGDPATLPSVSTPPPEVQHLSSPQNLPPGTTDVPLDQSRTGSYLRDLWHAVQTQDISGKEAALLFLTQRPMNANAMATNGLPAGPQAPPGTPPPLGAPAPDVPAPADAPQAGPAPLVSAPPPTP